jgi:hypothetical protein
VFDLFQSGRQNLPWDYFRFAVTRSAVRQLFIWMATVPLFFGLQLGDEIQRQHILLSDSVLNLVLTLASTAITGSFPRRVAFDKKMTTPS